jgi:ferritin-like metal-binding protein YciE
MAQKNQPIKSQATAATKKTTSGSIKTSSGYGQTSSSLSTSQNEKTLKAVFENCLNDIYSAEKQLIAALPEMVNAADNEELQDAFEHHLNQTKKHVTRLEKIFMRLEIEQNGESCKAMEGLIEESKKIISEFKQNAVRDAALIIGAQKIEHYEIAAYGSLCELADVLGHNKVGDILGRTLEEEEDTDEILTDLAKDINDEATADEEEDDDDEDEEIEDEE